MNHFHQLMAHPLLPICQVLHVFPKTRHRIVFKLIRKTEFGQLKPTSGFGGPNSYRKKKSHNQQKETFSHLECILENQNLTFFC